MSIFLCLFLSQITYNEGAQITLEGNPFSYERVFPGPEGLMVPNQELGVVNLYDSSGKQLVSFGEKGGEESMTLPTSAAWVPGKGLYYIYDSAMRTYHVWDGAYNHVKTIQTDFPMFFQAGPLQETDNGFVAAVSLQKDLFLAARMDDNFKNMDYGYPVVNTQLAGMSPVLYQTWLARADMYGGARLLAVQSLAAEVSMMDMSLNKTGSVSLAVPGWKAADYKKLEKVSKNPRELEKYKPKYSEVVALQTLQGSLFVVGFRNIFNDNIYYFQCYDASTGNALGQTFNTPHQPVGSGFGQIFLRKGGAGMKLVPVTIQ